MSHFNSCSTDVSLRIGPTSGAVYVEDAVSSSFSLASHQLRIHSANNCNFMLRVRSNPIIEHTTRVYTSPYSFHYPGIEEDFRYEMSLVTRSVSLFAL